MTPVGFVLAMIVVTAGAFVVASLKSTDGAANWVTMFAAVFACGFIAMGVITILAIQYAWLVDRLAVWIPGFGT